jgi:hypothetical protein
VAWISRSVSLKALGVISECWGPGSIGHISVQILRALAASERERPGYLEPDPLDAGTEATD